MQTVVSTEELARRTAANPVERPKAGREYRKQFPQAVTQADEGGDLDFLRAESLQNDPAPVQDKK
ncbi:hypothetical protein VOM14_29560 [Paraburkholderia sp. MPAMCS5]|uniref:hypothetical protein n=1 Tax=Paraburkholderia sp. MPAMCS5 TaxID=3112563 RepID=UPI002E175EF9|nr:hypothetical protein [Paraburkholderia sp. MPAMCS5]